MNQAQKEEENKLSKQTEEHHRKEENPFVSFIKWVFNWIVVPLIIVFLLHQFIFQPYSVSGNSMDPTLNNGDYLIISKLGSTWSNVKAALGSKDKVDVARGDIVVFRAPNSNLFFVKRVIALPKERIVISSGQVKIFNKDNPQGFVLNESYVNQKTEGDVDQIIDPGFVFVLGDNRIHNGSFDSRYFGPINEDSIIGNATVRLLPLKNMEIIKNPNY